MFSAPSPIVQPVVVALSTDSVALVHSKSEPTIIATTSLPIDSKQALQHSSSASAISAIVEGKDHEDLRSIPVFRQFADGETVGHGQAYHIVPLDTEKLQTIMFDKNYLPAGLVGGINWDKDKAEITTFFRGTQTASSVKRDSEYGAPGDATFWRPETQDYLRTAIHKVITAVCIKIAADRKCDPSEVKVTINVAGHSLGSADGQNFVAALAGFAYIFTFEGKSEVDGKNYFRNVEKINLQALNPAGIRSVRSDVALEQLRSIHSKFQTEYASKETKTTPPVINCYWVFAEDDPVPLSGQTMIFAKEHDLVTHHVLRVVHAKGNKTVGWLAWMASFIYDTTHATEAHTKKIFNPDTELTKWQYACSNMPDGRPNPEGRKFIDDLLTDKSAILQSYPIVALQQVAHYLLEWKITPRATKALDPNDPFFVPALPFDIVEMEDVPPTDTQAIRKLEQTSQKAVNELAEIKKLSAERLQKIEGEKNALEKKHEAFEGTVTQKFEELKQFGMQKIGELTQADDRMLAFLGTLTETDKAIENLVHENSEIHNRDITELKKVVADMSAAAIDLERDLRKANEKNMELKAELARKLADDEARFAAINRDQEIHKRENAKLEQENLQLKAHTAYKRYSQRVTDFTRDKQSAMWTVGISTAMVCTSGVIGLAGQYVSGLSIGTVATYYSGITASTIALVSSAMMIGAGILAVAALTYLMTNLYQVIHHYNVKIDGYTNKEFEKRGDYLSATIKRWEIISTDLKPAMKSPVRTERAVRFAGLAGSLKDEDIVVDENKEHKESKRSVTVDINVSDGSQIPVPVDAKVALSQWIHDLEEKMKALKCSKHTHKALYKHVQQKLKLPTVLNETTAVDLKKDISEEAGRLLTSEIENNRPGLLIWTNRIDPTVTELKKFFTEAAKNCLPRYK